MNTVQCDVSFFSREMVHQFYKEGVFHAPAEYEEGVKHLRAWLNDQPHLPNITDQHLYAFLHSCEGNLQHSKDTVEKYYTMRTHAPELFSNRNPLLPEIQHILDIW